MIPAIIVGALTAWYLGVRLGVIIAIVTAAALLVAMIVPGMSLAIYALVVAWSAALYFFGPKISKAAGKGGFSDRWVDLSLRRGPGPNVSLAVSNCSRQ